MSRSPEDPASRPPRRPRPAPDPAAGPDAGRSGMGSEPSTFRPNPVGSSGGGRPRSPKTRVGKERGDATFEMPASGPKWWERLLFGRVSSGQLAQFCRQFASYLHSGVDFTRALSSLEQQFTGTALGPVIGRIQMAIRRGSTLEEAMAREPQTFGPMFLSMIRVA